MDSSNLPVARAQEDKDADAALLPGEALVLQAAMSGEVADLTPARNDEDSPQESPGHGVRAEFLLQLATAAESRWTVHWKGIRLKGAVILGELNLEYARVAQPFSLLGCSFEAPITLSHARLRSLSLTDSSVPAIQADGVEIETRAAFGRLSSGMVSLLGARIDGALIFTGASLAVPEGPALRADRVQVGEGAFFDGGFSAKGQILLRGAQIGFELSFEGAVLNGQEGSALEADGVRVRGPAQLEGLAATGEVRLPGAVIDGQMVLKRATLTNDKGSALSANRVMTARDAFLDEGFSAHGHVRLIGAVIGGHLSFLRARIHGEVMVSGANVAGQLIFRNAALLREGGRALWADRISVLDNGIFDKGLSVKGEISLVRAVIGGSISFSDARLTNPKGKTIQASGIEVKRGAFFRGLLSSGKVELIGASIGGSLNFSGATLMSESGLALGADRVVVKGNAWFRDQFIAQGEIGLIGARIGGRLSFETASLSGGNGRALLLRDAKCNSLALHRLPHAPVGFVELLRAEVEVLLDDETSWSVRGEVQLDSFSYSSLAGPTDVPFRLSWLARQQVFSIDPYRRLAQVYRATGDDKAARRVAVAMERARVARGSIGWPGRTWNRFLGLTVGYGYRPGLALIWLFALVVVGSIAFSIASARDLMVPSDRQLHPLPRASRCVSTYPCFHPTLYTIDLILPVSGLDQEAWRPDASQPGGEAYRIAASAMRLSGLALVTAIAAGIVRVLRRE